jgi:hypothetical protein
MMETLKPSDFYGYTIFCDDIRHEVGGKVTFVGVYTKHMYVHDAFPCLLPKFGVWIQYNQHPDHIVKPIKFFIYLPGDKDDGPSIILQVPEGGTNDAIAKSGYLKRNLSLSDEINPTFVGMGSSNVFSPFIIPAPGLIMVRAVRNGTLVRLGSLAVMPAPELRSSLPAS